MYHCVGENDTANRTKNIHRQDNEVDLPVYSEFFSSIYALKYIAVSEKLIGHSHECLYKGYACISFRSIDVCIVISGTLIMSERAVICDITNDYEPNGSRYEIKDEKTRHYIALDI